MAKTYKIGKTTFGTLEAKQIWILEGTIHSLNHIGKETKLSFTEEALRKLSIRQINKVIKTLQLKSK